MSDRVRLLRVIQYDGERKWVEDQLSKSIHGTIVLPKGTITVVTLGEFPEEIRAPFDEAIQKRQDELAARLPGSIGGKR